MRVLRLLIGMASLLVACSFISFHAPSLVSALSPTPPYGEAVQLPSVAPGQQSDTGDFPGFSPTTIGPWSANGVTILPAETQTTTLSVSIISSPWATLDSNNPSGSGGEQVPRVFVVEAVITNTGSVTATNPLVTLDYDNPTRPAWRLQPGETPSRTPELIAPGAAHHAYWLAQYPAIIGESTRYTVTAQADQAEIVSTSNNSYGNPEPGMTVKTRSTVSTGNSGVTQVSANIVVGVAFTITVNYDLGTNPQDAIFSPVGNTDFDPSLSRLIATQVRFYNDGDTQSDTRHDRLYFDSLPAIANNAEVSLSSFRLNRAIAGFAPIPRWDMAQMTNTISFIVLTTRER